MPGFFEGIVQAKGRGQLLAAWIIEGEGAGTKALFARENGKYIPAAGDDAFPAAAADVIRELAPGTTGNLETAGSKVFLERIAGRRRLVVCGAGHVAISVIRLGMALGFEVTVIEDRAEFAERAQAAGAQHVLCSPFTEALDGIDGDDSTAFVVMTREHAHDVECLRRILGKTYAYAGMMGSRSRAEQIRKQMAGEGFDAGKVQELHMPIGLSIGSRTPEEIAVSVAAELISVMNAAEPGEVFPSGMAEELAARPRGVLAMIVEKNGEAPRDPGTKMLVREDGSFLGTVGGGYAEAGILKTAGQMIREHCGESRLVRISMEKGAMYCGGEIAVFLLPLQSGNGERNR